MKLLKNIGKAITYVAYDWKKDYVAASSNLAELEKRLKYVQESEQKLAELRLKCNSIF